MKCPVTIGVNGSTYQRDVEPRLLLVHFLRDAGLTGTKIGCDTSQCGACTVLLDGVAVKSCTLLAVQADGASVTTIEGLAQDGKLHPLQDAFWAKHGLQCGFCTPGMVFAAQELLRREPESDGRADPARPRRQHVPLHRLPEHRPRGAGCGRGSAVRGNRRCAMTPRSVGTSLRFGHPAPRGPAAADRHRLATPTTSCCPGMAARGGAAQPACACPDSRHRYQPAPRRAPAWWPSTPAADTEAGLKSHSRARGSCRTPDSRSRPTAPSPPTSCATSAMRSRWSSPRSDYQAYDALELIDVDYEPLPAVVDPEPGRRGRRAAAARGSARQPRLPLDGRRRRRRPPRSSRPTWSSRDRIIQQRLIPTAMETRGAVAQFIAGDRRADAVEHHPEPAHRPLHHVARDRRPRGQAARHRARSRRRLRQQDCRSIQGDFIAAFCSMKLGRPVKWIETRSRELPVDDPRPRSRAGRGAGGDEGRHASWACAPRSGRAWARISRRPRPAFPTILHGLMLSGPYNVPAVKEDVYGVYTNTTPVEAYRGAGRPEATFMLERMIDRLAHELRDRPGRDPAPQPDCAVRQRPRRRHRSELRQRQLPGGARQGARRTSATTTLRAEQAAAPRPGPLHRASASRTYVEICGLGPSQVAGAIGFQGGLWESAIVRFHPTGKVNVFIGASPHGQGEETTFAQIVADELGVAVDDVKVVHGDTDNTPMGWGTYGSRTTAVGGAALAVATRKIKEKAKLLASAPARGGGRGHGLRRRQVLREGLAGSRQDDPGHRADGERRLESAAGHGSRSRSVELLRSAELHLSVRRARRGRGSRSGTPARCA